MTDEMGGARPAADRPAADATVTDPSDIERARRMAAYRAGARRQASRALDRHIAHVYGPEVARAYGIRRWAA